MRINRARKEASFSGDRTAVPSDDGILRSEHSTTELAGPGIQTYLYDQNKFHNVFIILEINFI